MKLKIDFEDSSNLELSEQNGELYIDNHLMNYQLTKTNEKEYLLIKDSKVFNIHLLEKDGNNLKIKINGRIINLSVKDHIAQILEELGMDISLEETINEIAAPMPGSILEVNVSEGQEIQEGDIILILEAMKMENAIKSPVNGTIEKVHVSKGQNVEKNQVLVSF